MIINVSWLVESYGASRFEKGVPVTMPMTPVATGKPHVQCGGKSTPSHL
jgi:hypothetical protein